jgi:putative ABC transport system permease protein
VLTHYLLIAWRSFARAPFHTAISVAGLALGLACFVGANSFASYVESADRQHPNAERIYVMFQRTAIGSMGLSLPFMPDTSMLLAERLDAEFPQLVEVGRSRDLANASVTVGSNVSFRNLWIVDAGFMRIFDLPLVAGNVGTTASSQLLVTRETALALFGRTDVVGESVTISQVGDVEIAGVLATLPDPSHLKDTPFNDGLEGFVVTPRHHPRWEMEVDDPWRWLGGSTTYVLLPPDGTLDARSINARMPDFVARNVRSSIDGVQVDYELRHVSTLVGNNLDEALWGAFGLSVVDLLTLLGALVLGVACFNFVTLATTRAAARAQEVGLRKAVGALRRHVVAQHLAETMLIAGVATVLALGLLEVVVAAVARTFALALAPPSAADFGFWLDLLVIVVCVGVASGAYPALVSSRATPAHALRKAALFGGSTAFRAVALACQFAAASFLITAVVVVAEQNAALRRAGVGVGTDPLVVIPVSLRQANIDPDQFRARLLESPHVKEVTGTSMAPWENLFGGTGFSRTPADSASFVITQQEHVSYGYFETLETPVLAGRSFSRDLDRALRTPTDVPTNTIVIDRRAAEQFGWKHPAEAVGQSLYTFSLPAPVQKTIVGVVEHMPTRIVGGQFSSAFIYSLDNDGISLPIIRISAANVTAALAHIDAVWKSMAPTVPLKREFADERFARAYALFGHVIRAFTTLAGIAIAISALGLFAMAAYVLERRRREIGIRKTQGATAPALFCTLIEQFLRPVLFANVIAIPIAFMAARTYLGLFVTPVALTSNPFVSSLLVTLLVATVVVAHQVLRAVRVSPAALLRDE